MRKSEASMPHLDIGHGKSTNRTVAWMHSMPRAYKKALMVCADILLIPFALWLSLSLRLGHVYVDFDDHLLLFIAVPFFTIPVFVRLGLYRAVIRYVGSAAINQILMGVAISAGIVLALTLYDWPNGLPRSVFAIYGFVAFTLIGGMRLFARAIVGGRISWRGQRVAVYGAGASGRQLASMLRAGYEYRPVLFIDDNAELINQEVDGLRVRSSEDPSLERYLERLGVVSIFLAMPSVSHAVRRRIIKKLERMPFHVFTVPRLDEIVSGSAAINQIREIAAEDILGRDPVPPNHALLGLCTSGHVVMITGAGGSIGSELSRQIIALRPSCMILFERSEYALFMIQEELRRIKHGSALDVEVVGVLASVCDRRQVERVLHEYKVETIYHAAAYKHVPLVEHNPVAGIVNNVFGTRVVAQAARDCGAKHFVFISTDKAVRPTSFMGASKRLGELILQALAAEGGQTNFSMVRFGNVLDSSGSVVPLFRQQITNGGPVTVTHPDVKRYFMTIPEAVQLVIQAGAMAHGGDVFVLDMGEPVRICDLARQMIHLSGLEVRDEVNPDGDIDIVFTGLRPGEKLFEELLIGDNVYGTDHPKILRAQEDMLSPMELEELLDETERAVKNHDVRALRTLLMESVPGYRPRVDLPESGWAAADDLTGSSVLDPKSDYRH